MIMKKIIFVLFILPFNVIGQNPKSFSPAAFNDASRLERIKNAMPVIEKLYMDFAKANHVPGYAFGVVVGTEDLVTSGRGRPQGPASSCGPPPRLLENGWAGFPSWTPHHIRIVSEQGLPARIEQLVWVAQHSWCNAGMDCMCPLHVLHCNGKAISTAYAIPWACALATETQLWGSLAMPQMK
jgi:hypothetical protein